MSRQLTGTLTHPDGSPLSAAIIIFIAKDNSPIAILQDTRSEVVTDASGHYSVSLQSGKYAVVLERSLAGGRTPASVAVGSIDIYDGPETTLEALLTINDSVADPLNAALLQLVQAATNQASNAESSANAAASSASDAENFADTAATDAVAASEEKLSGYVQDATTQANNAKDAASAAAESAKEAANSIDVAYVMSEVQFLKNCETNKALYSGSGFIEYGRSSQGYDSVNSGLWSTNYQSDDSGTALLLGCDWGDGVYLEDRKTTEENTDFPVVNVNGVIIYLRNISSSYEGNTVFFPPVPDGKKTRLSGGGCQTYETSALAFAAETEDEKVILSRKDFMFLEVWHEKILDKDVVFPFGNVQYRKDEYLNIDLGNHTDGSYSAFGEWDKPRYATSALWSTLTEPQKALFKSKPENNIYQNANGDLVQVRYRVRVAEGYGDDWSSDDGVLETVGEGTYGVCENNLAVYVQGKSNTISSKYYFVRPGHVDASLVNDVVGVGVKVYDEASAYALPIALLQRRNTGVYHPSYNPNGAAGLLSNSLTMSTWSEYGNGTSQHTHPFYNTASCFFDSNEQTDFVINGRLIDGQSGREDHLYYDLIYAADVHDLRMNARKNIKPVDYWLNKAIANDIRHYQVEGAPRLVFKERVTETITSSDYIGVPYNLNGEYNAGDYIVVLKQDGSLVTAGYLTPFTTVLACANTYAELFSLTHNGPIERVAGNVYTILKVEYSSHSRENFTWTDIVGHPSNYPRQWTGIIDHVDESGEVIVSTGHTVRSTVNNSAGVTQGNIFIWTGEAFTGDISTFDFLDTQWVDLGTEQEFLDNATGFDGFPLLYGVNGEYLLSDVDSFDFMLSRKIDTGLLYTKSESLGVYWEKIAFDNASHPVNTLDKHLLDLTDKSLVFATYTTSAHIFKPTVPDRLVDAELSMIAVFSSAHEKCGAILASNLIYDIPSSDVAHSFRLPCTSYIYGSGTTDSMLLDKNALGSDTPPSLTHDVISLPQDEYHEDDYFGVKAVSYFTKDMSQLGMGILYRGLRYNSDWGDNGELISLNKVDSHRDTQGNLNVTGVSSIRLPFFIQSE